MPYPIVVATLGFLDGTPFSEAYGDVYHSAAGGLEQARHVFLGGNGLPQRWAGRERFVVLETGFGLGLNFLATWAAWRDDPRRPQRLHFVSVEKHPLDRASLARAHSGLPLDPLALQLEAQWPLLVPGLHRLAFEGGRVLLTLALGDARRVLPTLRLAADAICLDGFSPAKNPEMWGAEVLKPLARLAAPGCTVATWSAAGAVREALAAAGFVVEKRPGFAEKRDMTVGVKPGRVEEPSRDRRAIVIGAGIAGAAVTERLCARGWKVTLLERHAMPALEASGNPAASFHPIVTRDDSLLARLTRASLVAARARWSALPGAEWSACGALQLARDDREDAAMRAAIEAMGFDADYARYVTREEASSLAGVPVGGGGLWSAISGWAKPPTLVRALLAAAGERCSARYAAEVDSIRHEGGEWRALDAAGAVLAHAPVLVLANAAEAARLAPSRHLELRRVRGQLSFFAAGGWAPRAMVHRGGFAFPAIDGRVQVGASFDLDDDDPAPREDSHAGNRERLMRVLPEAAPGVVIDGRVAFRAVAPDRLPLVGAMADEAALAGLRNVMLASLPRREGLYGAFGYASRGVLWSSLAAEQLASLIEGEPLPLEAPLADAIDPARFALRALRRGRG